MRSYDMSLAGNKSLYQYLYECIRQDIVSGELKCGEKLPGKRALAANLGVSAITVENAYGELAAEGYLLAKPRSGFYVAEYVWEKGVAADPSEGKKSAGVNLLRQPKAKRMLIDLTEADTAAEDFPFTIWAKLTRRALSLEQEALMVRSDAAGLPALKSAIAGHLSAFRGISVAPEQVIVGAGTEYLYSILVKLLGRDKVYGTEDPGYGKPRWIFAAEQVRCRNIPLDASGLSVQALKRTDCQILHVTPSHHMPTGITMPVGRRKELLAWAGEEEDRLLLEDDYDSEFRLAGKFIPPLFTPGGKVIYLNTFTKSLSPTIRISYMVLPLWLLPEFTAKLSGYSTTVSSTEQLVLAHFIEEGYFGKHINRMRNKYRQRRDEVLGSLRESPLGKRGSVYGDRSGLHFVFSVDTWLSDRELKLRALASGVKLSLVSDYLSAGGQEDEAYRHQVIVRYTGGKETDFRQVWEKLYKAWFT